MCTYEVRIKIFHVIEMRVASYIELAMMVYVAYFVDRAVISFLPPRTRFKLASELYMLHCILQGSNA